LTIEIRSEDADGSYDGGYLSEFQLKQTRFFTNTETWYDYDANQYVYSMEFAPSTDILPANYSFFLLLRNQTDNYLINKYQFYLNVELQEVKSTFGQQKEVKSFSESQLAVIDTTFKISEITRGGLITIEFSKALLVPRNDNNEPNFSETPEEYAFVEFTKLSENDDLIEFTFKPVEFDINGFWCTFKLDFANPIFVSLGEYPDQVTVYMHKEHFLY
jgi:hypothetical protein